MNTICIGPHYLTEAGFESFQLSNSSTYHYTLPHLSLVFTTPPPITIHSQSLHISSIQSIHSHSPLAIHLRSLSSTPSSLAFLFVVSSTINSLQSVYMCVCVCVGRYVCVRVCGCVLCSAHLCVYVSNKVLSFVSVYSRKIFQFML